MTTKLWSSSAALACVTGIAILGFASTACALDAYWRGTRSDNWNDGRDPSTQLSNWYRDTAGQMPVPVPDRTAIFAGSAGRSPQVVDSVEIERIRLDPDAAAVEIGVAELGNLIITGAGIVNQSAVTPLFHVLGVMEFRGSAQLKSAGAKSAAFRVTRGAPFGALLIFRDDSKGGDASAEILHGHAHVQFVDGASAQNMVIANLFGNVDFFDRSTGGNAELVNHLNGRSDFASIGPQQDGIVTIGAIRNDGLMIIGERTNLVVRRNLVLDTFAQGKVRFDIRASGKVTRAGNIVVQGQRGSAAI